MLWLLNDTQARKLSETMFSDDFDEYRARSYSGGFLSFAVDGKRSCSDPSRCFEPGTTTTGSKNTGGNDVTVPGTDVQPGRVRERRHSDEMSATVGIVAASPGRHGNAHLHLFILFAR